MRIGKLIGKAIASPVALIISAPQIAADVVNEIGKAVEGK